MKTSSRKCEMEDLDGLLMLVLFSVVEDGLVTKTSWCDGLEAGFEYWPSRRGGDLVMNGLHGWNEVFSLVLRDDLA